jgi:hypothetical protein
MAGSGSLSGLRTARRWGTKMVAPDSAVRMGAIGTADAFYTWPNGIRTTPSRPANRSMARGDIAVAKRAPHISEKMDLK